MTPNLLFVVLPVGLLIVVSGLSFVGCAFNTQGVPPDFTTYGDSVVLADPDCVAFWPLNEEAGPTAIDAKGKQLGNPHNGTYFDKTSPANAGQYPCPSYMDLGGTSAGCSGTLTLGAVNSGIVTGDFVGDSPATAMQTDGAYVEIAANDVTTPATAFTVEAWINTGWDASDSDAVHTFLDFRSVNGSDIRGFALSVNAQGQLQGHIGLGSGGEFVIPGGQVALGSTAYVVLACDGTSATVFVNGNPILPSTPVPNGKNYLPNTTSRQVIGAGAPWVTNRTDQTASAFFPAFPFKGTIQDVAIYKAALSDATIAMHNANGNGMNTG